MERATSPRDLWAASATEWPTCSNRAAIHHSAPHRLKARSKQGSRGSFFHLHRARACTNQSDRSCPPQAGTAWADASSRNFGRYCLRGFSACCSLRHFFPCFVPRPAGLACTWPGFFVMWRAVSDRRQALCAPLARRQARLAIQSKKFAGDQTSCSLVIEIDSLVLAWRQLTATCPPRHRMRIAVIGNCHWRR